MEKRHVYTTVNGLEVEYKAISLDALKMSKRGLERSYRERNEPIDPPTYEITTASGAKIAEMHDATTEKSEEDQVAWNAYIDANKRMTEEGNLLIMRYILDDGLGHIQLPEDDSWTKKYQDRFIDLPTDLPDLRNFYITHEILPTKSDRIGLTNSVLLLSEQGKVDPDALEARLEMFQRRIRRKAAKRADITQEQMEAQPEIDGG